MKPWLTVVVPTAGQRHAGLLRTVDSIRQQPGGHAEQTEILVVVDTYGEVDRAALDVIRTDLVDTPRNCRWEEFDGGIHCYGQPQRTHGSRIASAEWVAYSQDDNILAKGALDHIWQKVSTSESQPLFFRVQTYWGQKVWRDRQLYQGNIDADCLVLPRELASEVTWGLRYEGDFDAAVDAVQRAGRIGWCEAVIALARPEKVWWQ